MRHRVFVAVNPDEQTIAKIGELADECRKRLPPGIERQIRFLPPGNWHITLSFLGYQDEADVEKVKVALEEAAKLSAPFKIQLERLVWGPPAFAPASPRLRRASRAAAGTVVRQPRMIWLMGDSATSKTLGGIKNTIEDILETKGVPFDRETRPFNAHITLARFDIRLPQEKPQIERPVSLRSEVGSLDLMESELRRGGAIYTLLSRFPLSG